MVTVDRDETASRSARSTPRLHGPRPGPPHQRDGKNYRVRYAIAHLPSYVAPGGAIDAETRRGARRSTHPTSGPRSTRRRSPRAPRASSPTRSARPTSGTCGSTPPGRAPTSRSTRPGSAAWTASTTPRSSTRSTQGRRRAARPPQGGRAAPDRREAARAVPTCRSRTRRSSGPTTAATRSFRPPCPPDWNAQISLMTGMAAAELMIGAKVGILRTMPPADQRAVDRFRRQARALGIEWSGKQSYGEFLRSLDRDNPKHLALIYEATGLFRGAGYTPFDGAVPDSPSTRPSRAPTPTSPPPSGGSSTASAWRCAPRSRPGRRCPPGPGGAARHSRGHEVERPAGQCRQPRLRRRDGGRGPARARR